MNYPVNESMNCRIFFFLGLLFMPLAFSGCVETSAPAGRTNNVVDPIDTAYYVQVGALNLRDCPSTKCRIDAVLSLGEPVTVIREDSGWYEIYVGRSGKKGWVSAKFIGALRPVKARAKAAPEKRAPAMPEEEFAPAVPAESVPPVEEEFGPVGGEDSLTDPPPVKEEFAE